MKGYQIIKFGVHSRIEKSSGKKIFYPSGTVKNPDGVEMVIYALIDGAWDCRYDMQAVITKVREKYPSVDVMHERAQVGYNEAKKSWYIKFVNNNEEEFTF